MIYAKGTSVRCAREEAVEAVQTIAQLIEPTLGPAGSDVLITTPFGEIFTTNDGATVMREVPIVHPAARIAADIALSQERIVGDGTTSTVVLASKLITELSQLIETNGLISVLEGLGRAQRSVEKIIEDESKPLKGSDLPRIVRTTLAGKAGEEHADLIAQLLIESIREPDSHVAYTKKIGAPMSASHRLDGVLVDVLPVREDMPRTLNGVRMLLISSALEARTPSGLSIGSVQEAERFFSSERAAAQTIASTIIGSGANLVICRKGIDDTIQHELARAGIVAVRRVPLEALETISHASGARILPTLEGVETALGDAPSMRIVPEQGVLIGGIDASTIVICGATEHVAEELLRAASDAEGVIRSARRDPLGVGGALVIEARASRIADDAITAAVGRAFEGLARAMIGSVALPRSGRGYDVRRAREVDAWSEGIIEPAQVKRVCISNAFEIARIILRVETIVSLPENPSR
jgi:archaeal chaperonin